MDQKQLQDIIVEFYEKLPQDAQQVFAGMQWMEILTEIAAMHNLNPNQIETLATETTLALLGVIHFEEYTNILTKELSLPKDLTNKIITEVSEKIFKSLHPSLQAAYEQNVQDIEEMDRDAQNEEGIDPRLALLPQNVQQAIISSDYKKKLYEIGTKHKLNIPAMAGLEDVTIKFISGGISSTQYESNLSIATDLPATAVKEIVQEVNDTILVAVRRNMQQQDAHSTTDQASQDDDLDVPIPPYAHEHIEQDASVAIPNHVAPVATPIATESNATAKTETAPAQVATIQLQEIGEPVESSERGILADAGIEIVGVESQKTDRASSIENKSFGPTKTQTSARDYLSVPKTTPALIQHTPSIAKTNPLPTQPTVAPTQVPPRSTNSDPYHEPIN